MPNNACGGVGETNIEFGAHSTPFHFLCIEANGAQQQILSKNRRYRNEMNTSDKILTNFANSMYACMNIEYAFTTPRVHARMKNTNINGDENEQNGMNS